MHSAEEILRLIREKVHHPASVKELLQALKIPKEGRATFRRHLKSLLQSGELVQTRGKRYGVSDRMDLVVGRIQMLPAGYGFVVAEKKAEEIAGDVYIAAPNLKEAMHGDRVVARVERRRDDGRSEGRVIRILERSNSTLVGRFDIDESGLAFVAPFDRRLLMDVHVPAGETGDADPGDMVSAEITRWPTATRGPVGRVVEVLGDIDTPGVDTLIVIRKYGINDEHSSQAVEEAKRLGRAVSPEDVRRRTDFRAVITVTIDGEHARDFDDAITIERLPNGNYWLGVHIADVAHYVQEGSLLDQEAFERGTSVYFPERAVHMFPSELATGLCSLNPHVDRLVQSCLMEVDRRGEVVRYELHDGVVKSDARMTYTEVNAILGEGDARIIRKQRHLVPTFELMRELYGILSERRRRRGSVNFDLPEAEVLLDADGLVKAIVAAERNVAHLIIEEFMLLANETVAEHMLEEGTPTLYRVHEEPDPLRVKEFDEFVSSLGYSLNAPLKALRPRHFQRLIERLAGRPEEKPVVYLMLRTMQRARYDSACLGHFGLATPSYTHFTSPIRRYPDLVVHRTLRESRHGRITNRRRHALEEKLPEIARHTSERERRADDAERELLQWKKVRFMSDKVGESFDGYITGVAPFGLFVTLVEHFVEGMVHVSTMADDYYRYLDPTHSLRGENTGKVYRLGDMVRVQVAKVDMEHRRIDLGLVEIIEAVREGDRRRTASRASGRRKTEGTPKQRPGRRERADLRSRGRS
jgi:ribonuclease R